MLRILRRYLIGNPLENAEMAHERLPKWKALSIFSSDALSSVAYGPEQAMIILVAAPSLLSYGYLGPIAVAIFLLLFIVALSYAQVAKANPTGGGAYAVAKANLGELPALIAAAAVFADYILTAAVSVCAGTDAIISAFPALSGWQVRLDIFVLVFILMLVNLRGVRESSNAFVFPTYAFLFGIMALIGTGIYQAFAYPDALIPPVSLAREPLNWTMLFVVLRAFANGCSSMTGIEAIADSVPLFNKPADRNAVATTYWMAGILGFMLLGISFLMMHYHVTPVPDITALSQIAENVFGRSALYYYIQITTMVVLYLAANTAYNGLPILLSIVAKDGYMPRYLAARGERLTYSNNIILLTLAAVGLILAYGGDIEHLISLYAIGVFLSFTIAQCSLVIHWHRKKDGGWIVRAIINGTGAVVTGIVVIIITVTKFMQGAWVILIFIPVMTYIFKKIRRHYDDVAEQLSLSEKYFEKKLNKAKGKNLAVVPISSPTSVVAETLNYAESISDSVIALFIATDNEVAQKIEEKWAIWNPGIQLVTIYSPYRLVVQPILNFVSELHMQKCEYDYITIVIPEFEPKEWWHRLLHGQTGWILRTLLILKEDVAVVTLPYHLKK
jgi:amino acid transporter